MLWGIIYFFGGFALILVAFRWFLTKWRGSIDRSNEINVKGKTVIITGASSGIGKAAALEFAVRDANVILACRSMEKAKAAVAEIRSKTSRGQLIIMELELASLDSVRKFCKEFKSKYNSLDILVNNAGVMVPAKSTLKTKDGFEMHFGVNHLGHFLLTNLLLESLKNSPTSRVVTLSSMAHSYGSLDYDDLLYDKVKPTGAKFFDIITQLYANSKLANALFSKELGKRLAGTGVRTYSLCPGFVFTEIGRDVPAPFFLRLLGPLFWYLLKTPEEGAQTILYCALSKNLAHESGQMYRNCKYWEQKGRIQLKDDDACKLWEASERFVGLPKSK